MSSTNPESEYEALFHLIRRMETRFPFVAEDVLLEIVTDEVLRFDGARLREYVPLLVERGVRERLRTQHAA